MANELIKRLRFMNKGQLIKIITNIEIISESYKDCNESIFDHIIECNRIYKRFNIIQLTKIIKDMYNDFLNTLDEQDIDDNDRNVIIKYIFREQEHEDNFTINKNWSCKCGRSMPFKLMENNK